MALILVVDDDQAVRSALRFVLEVEGFDVRLYESAAELLEGTEPADSDCLVVDHLMSAMTGIELVKALRARQCDLPALLMTTSANRDLRRRAARAGIGDVLEKPLCGSALIEAIRTVLARR